MKSEAKRLRGEPKREVLELKTFMECENISA